jgi:uncharacterized protein
MMDAQTNDRLGLRWNPTRDTAWALVSYGLVVAALYVAFQVFTTANVAGNFLMYGPVTLALLGVGVPALYTTLVRRRGLEELGITTRWIIPSLALGAWRGYETYQATLANLDVEVSLALVPLVTLALTVGLFEAVFFRGWLQMRFEEAFGLVPGLFLGAACYALYHVGYGMQASELLFLFGLGLVFGAFFRLTRSIFVLWPLLTPMGGLYTNLSEGLTLPLPATYGFIITVALMAGLLILAARLGKRRQ